MNTYEAKQAARKERLERAALRAQDAANASSARARSYTAGIPFGQPILIGHHSEGKHRAALKRQDGAMRKAAALYDASKDLAYRAAAVGTGGISSDDPDALEKLTDKRTELEQERDQMKEANSYYKKHGTLEGWDGPAKLIADGLVTLRVQAYYGKPFPPYALTNIGARIRQAAKRSAQVAKLNPNAERVVEEFAGGCTVIIDEAENRVRIKWGARLSRENYKNVRSAGFVWARTEGAFQRKFSNGAIRCARELAKEIAARWDDAAAPEYNQTPATETAQ